MFAAAEFALIVCGAAMAVSVRHTGRPAPGPKIVVWAMCTVAAYMAIAEAASTAEAIGRILLGPALAAIMLHLGLGLEIRLRPHRTPNPTFTRIWTEIRERALSRLGLADDQRTAAQRTRDRKALKAAALSRPRRAPWSRPARLERAVLAAGIADNPELRNRMLARIAACQNAHQLGELAQTADAPRTRRTNYGAQHAAAHTPTTSHTHGTSCKGASRADVASGITNQTAR